MNKEVKYMMGGGGYFNPQIRGGGMFRRRTSSSGKIHYRINIDKSMCPNPVDIYIDGDTYQSDFNGSYLDIYRNKKIEVIRIGGQIVSKDQQYEYNVILGISGGIIEGTLTYQYNSGMHCELANKVIYGNRITNFVPVTVIKDPGEIINFTYRSELQAQVLDESYVSWDGDYVLNDNCIVTDLCSGCESYTYGKSSHGNYRVTVRIV